VIGRDRTEATLIERGCRDGYIGNVLAITRASFEFSIATGTLDLLLPRDRIRLTLLRPHENLKDIDLPATLVINQSRP
jgi:hypothetical protein